ncbi:hypothetical protein ACLMJK_005108 [Lecanora helva]
METTFITIHDLSLDARILYASTSIEDILGYNPQEVVGKSCWEYFHPDEIPFARAIHGRGVQLDKAAVLNYCQIKNRDGRWVGCECVFTIVHDVLVGCTSVYRRGTKSHLRAREAPVIRRMFSSSPRDPRYHMLSYISQKFSKPSQTPAHEPRAALFLNRFSRTLTIMYATNSLADIIGVSASDLCGKSFYYCIQENCLREAVKCLESAKANDSIAYLRFWFRDPRQDNQLDHDEHMSDGHSSGDEDDGGVHISDLMDHDGSENAVYSDSSNSLRSSVERDQARNNSMDPNSRSSSGNGTDLGANNDEAIFDRPERSHQSSASSISIPDEGRQSNASWSRNLPRIELEAVVSCTSDGLVVVLRRAKALVCHMPQPLGATQSPFANGYFASPWASSPILPDEQQYALPHLHQTSHPPIHPTVAESTMAATKGPATEDFMNSIREVAVFAWALTGINGSLEQFSRGTPSGESQPPGGLPVWDPHASAGPEPSRPIGGAYYTNGRYDARDDYWRNGHSGSAAGGPSNDRMQINGDRNHLAPSNRLIQYRRDHQLNDDNKTTFHNQIYPTSRQVNGEHGQPQTNGHNDYLQHNGYHGSALPQGQWPPYSTESSAIEREQNSMNTNGHLYNGAAFR